MISAFTRAEFVSVAKTLGIVAPSNLGDVLYSFRYRNELPKAILDKQPAGRVWVIFPNGRGLRTTWGSPENDGDSPRLTNERR